MTTMSLRQKAVKGVLWSGIQNWGSSLIAMVVIVILARTLTKADFGLVALAMIFIEFLGAFQRQGFSQALIQRAELEPRHLDTAFWTSAVAGLLLGGLVFASATLIATVLGEEELGEILRWLAAVVVIEAMGTTPQAILRRDLAFRSLAWRSLGATAVGGGVGVTMALCGYGVWSLVGQQIASSATGVLVVWIASRWIPASGFSKRHFKDLFGFGMFTMGREVVDFLNQRIDELLIGLLLGKESLGVYKIGRQLITTINRLFTRTLSAVALPTFSRLQHDHGQMRQALLSATGMATLVAFPAFLGVAILAPELAVGLFGEAWVESGSIMRILAVGALIQCVVFFNNPVIVACGKPSWVLGTSIGNVAVGAILFGLAAPWGIVAVAAARVVRNYVYAPVPLLLVRKLIGLDVREYCRSYLAPLGSSLIMVAAVWAMKETLSSTTNTYAALAIAIATGLIAYFASMRFFAPQRLAQVREYVRLAVGIENS